MRISREFAQATPVQLQALLVSGAFNVLMRAQDIEDTCLPTTFGAVADVLRLTDSAEVHDCAFVVIGDRIGMDYGFSFADLVAAVEHFGWEEVREARIAFPRREAWDAMVERVNGRPLFEQMRAIYERLSRGGDEALQAAQEAKAILADDAKRPSALRYIARVADAVRLFMAPMDLSHQVDLALSSAGARATILRDNAEHGHWEGCVAALEAAGGHGREIAAARGRFAPKAA